MRRTQRSSQRSADSKLTGSGVYQPGPGSDSGVVSMAESDRMPGVTSLTSERIPGVVEDNGVEKKKKSTTLMLDVRPLETGNGVQYLDAPKTGVGTVTSSEDIQDREGGRVSARDRLVYDG